ncbi:uncharacterized protein SAPINGB_P004865 [Magnusiomyces paraingens]|uniref:Pre-mRNA-splicing factor CWC26 n=1 Tax=Magnusiomyces paraingens TaxID=2606893 RepID=A0A5E8BXH6_9ASCO|nr:uncharacterized protein SAPINGB_P004865 [Saprochaete ingens]VVT56154.1 unnamed protein product [Saprochaete ingens]
MSALKDYLSKKYLDPVGSDKSEKKTKKKKRKNDPSNKSSGSVIKDDDEGDTLLTANKPSKRVSSKNMTFEEYTKRRKLEYADDEEEEEEEEEGEEYNQNKDITKIKKKNAWKRLDGSTKMEEPDKQLPADTSALSLHNKYYGLQTADQIADQMREKAEAEAAVRAQLATTTDIDAHDTVHRDAQGRRIDDIESIRQAELEAEAAEKRAREQAHRRINAGVVQLRMEQEGAQDSSGTRYTRHADDAELNAQQRSKVDTFHDPAATFLKKKKTTALVKSSNTKSRHADDGLSWKIYPGPYPPNRFDIPPGSMWDGVDRSNGFEKLWFQKESQVKELKNREYTSSYDI